MTATDDEIATVVCGLSRNDTVLKLPEVVIAKERLSDCGDLVNILRDCFVPRNDSGENDKVAEIATLPTVARNDKYL